MKSELYSASRLAIFLGVSPDDMIKLFHRIDLRRQIVLDRIRDIESRRDEQVAISSVITVKVRAFHGYEKGDGSKSKMTRIISEIFEPEDFEFAKLNRLQDKETFCAVIRNDDFSKFEHIAYKGLKEKKAGYKIVSEVSADAIKAGEEGILRAVKDKGIRTKFGKLKTAYDETCRSADILIAETKGKDYPQYFWHDGAVFRMEDFNYCRVRAESKSGADIADDETVKRRVDSSVKDMQKVSYAISISPRAEQNLFETLKPFPNRADWPTWINSEGSIASQLGVSAESALTISTALAEAYKDYQIEMAKLEDGEIKEKPQLALKFTLYSNIALHIDLPPESVSWCRYEKGMEIGLHKNQLAAVKAELPIGCFASYGNPQLESATDNNVRNYTSFDAQKKLGITADRKQYFVNFIEWALTRSQQEASRPCAFDGIEITLDKDMHYHRTRGKGGLVMNVSDDVWDKLMAKSHVFKAESQLQH
jgi:hypothetical protein